ncbi:glutathione S-transferase family protein [Pendulispora brunnea]|uniref:Glutathione S-transferase family protein n=1 Tax=Pendulispora brunnea TaxID=2905690 RepID=A0ABZ2K1I8_9BACT
MILYHFLNSPFARRVRFAMVLKGISVELRDARATPENQEAVHCLNPVHTVPVLVDGDRVISDSTAICHYLDRKFPEPPLWPAGMAGADAFEFVALTDSVVHILSDLGMRYHPLHEHPQFPEVRDMFIGRVQRVLDRLAQMVSSRPAGEPLCGPEWSGADIAVYTLVIWLEGLPARAATFPPAKWVVDLGWSLPQALRTWADPHRWREDVLITG